MRPEGPHRVPDWTRYGPTDNQTILRALPNDLQTIISKLTLCPLGVFGALTRGPKRCLILPILGAGPFGRKQVRLPRQTAGRAHRRPRVANRTVRADRRRGASAPREARHRARNHRPPEGQGLQLRALPGRLAGGHGRTTRIVGPDSGPRAVPPDASGWLERPSRHYLVFDVLQHP